MSLDEHFFAGTFVFAATHHEANSSDESCRSLRMSPLVPGWFLSIATPLTPVPLWQFVLATLVGVVPVSLVAVKTGATLSRLGAGEEHLLANGQHVGMLLVLAALAAIPAVVQRWRGQHTNSGFAAAQEKLEIR